SRPHSPCLRVMGPDRTPPGGEVAGHKLAATVSTMPLGVNAATARPPYVGTSVLLSGAAAASVIFLHLATNGNLGFHTDELYYLDCGNHPALGYVDFPPVVPLFGRLETALLGTSPWNLRLLPTLLGGLMVALSAAYVRRLGGSLSLQAL